MSFWKWSRTAATNSTADSSINWAEGQAPSSVNDSARAMMAACSKYRDDVSASIATGGASSAYTVTSYQSFDTLAHLDGAVIGFVPHTTSAAAPTLNVDGLGAKTIRLQPSVDLPTGTLVQGTPYVCVYNNSDAIFYLRGVGTNPYNIPLGGMLPYMGTTAPNTAFVFPFGQAISRTTYATLFTLCSTTFGVGDGATTFNIIDMRGRLPIGMDTMPGSSAASRVTTAGSSIDGTTVGATGGAQTVTLAQSALPNISPTISFSGTQQVRSDTTTTATQTGAGYNGVDSVRFSAASATASSINGNVTQTAVNKMPPGIIVPYILRII